MKPERMLNEKTMNKNGTIKILSCVLVGLTLALTSCGGGGGTASVGGSGTHSASGANEIIGKAPVLWVINVSPSNSLGLKSGTQLQFAATGFYSDNSMRDVTTLVIWTSSDPSVAVVSNEKGSIGVATAVSRGYCSISATLEGVSISTVVGVN